MARTILAIIKTTFGNAVADAETDRLTAGQPLLGYGPRGLRIRRAVVLGPEIQPGRILNGIYNRADRANGYAIPVVPVSNEPVMFEVFEGARVRASINDVAAVVANTDETAVALEPTV